MVRISLLALAATALIAAGCGDDDGDSGATPAANGDAMAKKTDAAMKADERMKSDDAMEAGAAKGGVVVKAISSEYGRVIADKKGEAFYLFDREKGRKSECYGECAVAWPPVLTKAKPRAGNGAKAPLLGTSRRRDGKLQATYAGHPLYYYKDDSPGTILCHDVDEFGGLWLVVKPSGKAAG